MPENGERRPNPVTKRHCTSDKYVTKEHVNEKKTSANASDSWENHARGTDAEPRAQETRNDQADETKASLTPTGSNPAKASARVTINSFMMGAVFFVLTLLWTGNVQATMNAPFHGLWVSSQLVLSIPLFFFSSLAYAKVGYHADPNVWNAHARTAFTIGNALVFNAIGLMSSLFSPWLAMVYFVGFIALMSVYTRINVRLHPSSSRRRWGRFALLASFLVGGGLFPFLLSYHSWFLNTIFCRTVLCPPR